MCLESYKPFLPSKYILLDRFLNTKDTSNLSVTGRYFEFFKYNNMAGKDNISNKSTAISPYQEIAKIIKGRRKIFQHKSSSCLPPTVTMTGRVNPTVSQI